MAVRWAYKGQSGVNAATPLVADFLSKKQLAKLGYQFDPDELTDIEIQSYGLIASELGKLESEDMKKASKARRGRNHRR